MGRELGFRGCSGHEGGLLVGVGLGVGLGLGVSVAAGSGAAGDCAGRRDDRGPVRSGGGSGPGEASEVCETYTITTTLLDQQDADADTIRAAYTMRWLVLAH